MQLLWTDPFSSPKSNTFYWHPSFLRIINIRWLFVANYRKLIELKINSIFFCHFEVYGVTLPLIIWFPNREWVQRTLNFVMRQFDHFHRNNLENVLLFWKMFCCLMNNLENVLLLPRRECCTYRSLSNSGVCLVYVKLFQI